MFADQILMGINQAWIADITYIRILKGFVFLAAILDRYSRKVIGWAISKQIDAELCLAAVENCSKSASSTPDASSLRSRRAVYLPSAQVIRRSVWENEVAMFIVSNANRAKESN